MRDEHEQPPRDEQPDREQPRPDDDREAKVCPPAPQLLAIFHASRVRRPQ